MANMIGKEDLKKILYFDIETAGITNTFEELETENPRLAKLWEKRSSWLLKNSGEGMKDYTPADFWKAKSSLHPEFSKIVCITFGCYDEDKLIRLVSFSGEEDQILMDSNKIFNNAFTKGWKLAGHTIKNFDIPFVGKRMIINKIKPSHLVAYLNRKPWESPHLDISDIFAFGGWGQTHTSLDLMACVLEIESPKDNMDGSMVHEYFYGGKIDDIKKYCEMDVTVLMKCFDALSFD